MADLEVQPGWPAARQLDRDEFASGGPDGNLNEHAKVFLARTEFLKEKIDNISLNYNKILYVGDNEIHKKIGSALAELSTNKPTHIFNDDSEYRANIVIRSGYIVQEQININGIDFSFVTITSEDDEVLVDQAALVKKVGRWYSFIRVKNGAIPNIATLFNMNRQGVLNERVGLYMINSRGFVNENCGIKNAGDRNCISLNARC